MIEPEVAFADLDTVIRLAEDMVKFTTSQLLERSREDLELFQQYVDKSLFERLERTVSRPFACVSYTEAVEILQKAKSDWRFPVSWGASLQREHERYLAETHFENTPVFVTDFPREIKSFYMKLNPDQRTVSSMDLLVSFCCILHLLSFNAIPIALLPHYESNENLLSAGTDHRGTDWRQRQRGQFGGMSPPLPPSLPLSLPSCLLSSLAKVGASSSYRAWQVLKAALKRNNLREEDYTWYLDLRKYGSVPHAGDHTFSYSSCFLIVKQCKIYCNANAGSGFGLGFERFIQYLTGIENIRDAVPVPRHHGYCKF
jgi:aspartyl/asparaginyl-tRNA synthetase